MEMNCHQLSAPATATLIQRCQWRDALFIKALMMNQKHTGSRSILFFFMWREERINFVNGCRLFLMMIEENKQN